MKNHHHHNPIHPQRAAAMAAPTHDAIALRAHAIWVAQGRHEHHDQAHWLEAERQLLASGEHQPQRNLALSTDS